MSWNEHTGRPQENKLVQKEFDIFEKEHALLPVASDTSVVVTPKAQNKGVLAIEKEFFVNIELNWSWDGLEKSEYQIMGKINNKNIRDNTTNPNENLEEWFLKFFPNWNRTKKRLKISIDDLSDDERKSFLKDIALDEMQGFKDVHFNDTPLMPLKLDTANKWMLWLLEEEVKREYFGKDDYKNIFSDLRDQDGFSSYKNKIKSLTVDEFEKHLYKDDKNRAEQSPAFWHLVAPNDLNPDGDRNHIIDKIEFSSGDTTTLQEIADKIKEGNDYSHIFYLDWFTHEDNQQKKIIEYFKAFGVEKKYLITFTNPRKGEIRSDVLQKKSRGIIELDIRDLTQNKPHDRYVVFVQEGEDELVVWKQTQSMDFIDFKGNGISKDSNGTTKDVGFYKVNETILDSKLFLHIKKQAGKED